MTDNKIIRVRDVMDDQFLSMDGLRTVQEALEAFQERGPLAIIVNKRSPDDEFGLVLLGDIATQVLARDRSPDRVNIYEIMIKPPLNVPPEMDVRYCARLFERFRVSKAPVIAEGKVLGMVDYHGLVLRGLLQLYA